MPRQARPLSRKEKARLNGFGSKIRAIRLQKGLTLEQVEERGFPSWKHLQAIETGRKNLTITSFFRLTDALDVEPADLIRGIK